MNIWKKKVLHDLILWGKVDKIDEINKKERGNENFDSRAYAQELLMDAYEDAIDTDNFDGDISDIERFLGLD